MRNDSIVTQTVAVEIDVWLAHESDELRALEVIAAAVDGRVGDDRGGDVRGHDARRCPASRRRRSSARPREAELRRDVAAALRSASLR